jgi:hypothetical protein
MAITMTVSNDHNTYTLFNDEGDELRMVRKGLKWLAAREKEILGEQAVWDLEN